MKKIVIFLVAVVPAIVPAKQLDNYSKEELANIDKMNWGAAESSLSPEAADFVTTFLNQVYEIIAQLEACKSRKALEHPHNSDSALEALLNALRAPIASDRKPFSLDKMPGVSTGTILGYKRANALMVVSKLIGPPANKELYKLVDYVLTYRLVRLYGSWSICQNGVAESKLVEKFKAVDAGWLKFKNAVDTMVINRSGQDVLGSELLKMSGLDKYFENDLRLDPSFNYWVRIIDRYNEEVYSNYSEYHKRVKSLREETLTNLIESFGKYYDAYQDMAVTLAPEDRPVFDKYFKLWSVFFDDLGNLLDKSWELIMAAGYREDDVGKLRFCRPNDISPNGAFGLGGPCENGKPNYKRRLKLIADDCKNRYLKHRENLRRDFPNDKRIPKGWE